MQRILHRLSILSLLVWVFSSHNATAQVEMSDSTGLEKDVVIIQYDYIPNDLKISDLYVAKGNKVWTATSNGVYQLFATSSRPYLNGKMTTALTEDRSGDIWAGGPGTLYNVTKGTSYPLPNPSAQINDMTYQGGKIWIATNDGIYTYNETANKFRHFDERNSKLKAKRVNFIQTDDEDVIWAGTSNGYIRIKEGDWETEDKGYDVVISQSNKEGQWMVATDDMWLINRFNRKFPVGLDESLYRGEVNDFVIDSKGRLYMASNILVRYDPSLEKSELYGAEVGLLAKRTISLACDFNNNIWIGTEGSGLFRIVFADIAAEQLTATIEVTDDIACADDTEGSFLVKVVGGDKPYKYKWNDSNLRGKSPRRIAPGNYTVTVTDKKGAESIASIDLETPPAIDISLVETQRVSSEGAKDGFIEITATGGSGDLTYQWDSGKSGARVTRLAAGQHIVTVTDANGCSVTKSYSVKNAKSFPTLDASQLTVGQTLRINNLYFLADSSEVTEDSYEVMDEVYEFLLANDNVVIEIGGHTNTIPSHAYCDELSSKRAANVADYLYDRGIPANRVTHKGYGKRQPITEDRSLNGRRLNQRVEVKILSIE